MQEGGDIGASRPIGKKHPNLLPHPKCCMIPYAVDLTISGPCAYVDLRDVQQGHVMWHTVIFDRVLMNFYYDHPQEGISMLTEYARNMAISYLIMHQVHFQVHIGGAENLIVRINELKDNRNRFVNIE